MPTPTTRRSLARPVEVLWSPAPGARQRRQPPAQRAQPEQNAARGQPDENPPKNDLDIVKRKFDQGRQDEHHIYRVRKPLLVLRVIGTRSIEQPPVISLLSFKVDLPAVGIASMQEQLARSQPARIQVGKIAPRPAV